MKKEKRNIRDKMRENLPPRKVLTTAFFFIDEMDKKRRTKLSNVFKLIYFVEEAMTMEELAERMNYSLTGAAKRIGSKEHGPQEDGRPLHRFLTAADSPREMGLHPPPHYLNFAEVVIYGIVL